MAKRNVFKEAKTLRNKHPKKFKTWQEYVSYAGNHKPKAVGRTKKKRMPKKNVRRKVTGHHTRKTKKRMGVESGVSTRSRTHTDYNRNKVNITVGAVNKHKKKAREGLALLIGREQVKKFLAPLKRQKKKIQKTITRYTAAYRRLATK